MKILLCILIFGQLALIGYTSHSVSLFGTRHSPLGTYSLQIEIARKSSSITQPWPSDALLLKQMPKKQTVFIFCD